MSIHDRLQIPVLSTFPTLSGCIVSHDQWGGVIAAVVIFAVTYFGKLLLDKVFYKVSP